MKDDAPKPKYKKNPKVDIIFIPGFRDPSFLDIQKKQELFLNVIAITLKIGMLDCC